MFSLFIAYWLISAFFHSYNYIQHKNVVKISWTLPIWYNLWYNIAYHAGNIKSYITYFANLIIQEVYFILRDLSIANTSLVWTGTEHDSSFFPISKYTFLTVFFILWKETQSDLHEKVIYLFTTIIFKTIVLSDDF